MKRRVWIALGFGLLLVAAGALVYHLRNHGGGPTGIGPFGPTEPARRPLAHDARPNIVQIVTDDQEKATLRYMPNTRALIASRGVQFTQDQTSFSLCAPSRASMLTGQYAHNTGVLDNSGSTGGWKPFNANGTEARALPVAMQRAGYNTIFVGKYINGWGDGRENPRRTPQPAPPGWNRFIGLVGRSVYSMWGYTIDNNGHSTQYPNDPSKPAAYQTDVLAGLAAQQIRQYAKSPRPFMLDVFPATPHVEKNADVTRGLIRPAPRDANKYPNLRLRRTPSFNEADVSGKPLYIRRRRQIGGSEIRKMTVENRDRVLALQSVDDMVGRVVKTLAETGRLNNTVIVFTSDNGYLLGQHRIVNGKIVPYLDSVRVPLVVSGPGFSQGVTSPALVANIDLAPTYLQLAGATSLLPVDGASLLPLLKGKSRTLGRDLLLESYISSAGAEAGTTGTGGDKYEPYKALRSSRWLYVEYADPRQGIELYNLRVDPDNLHNLAYDPRYTGVVTALHTRLAAIRNCRGAGCRIGGGLP